ncbi:hypothetical protein FACS189493_5760 [Spirochaetia bacterium]|nr:hypothetical protein FACS189493_5760 [Spirochaetia bacterium]
MSDHDLGSAHDGVTAYVPALIGALVCVAINRTGFLGPLFMLPMGILGYCYNSRTAWFCLALVVLGNGIFALGMGFVGRFPPGALALDALYFTVITAGFTWVCAPPETGPRFLRIRGVYRLIAASVAGALALLPLVYTTGDEGGLVAMVRSQAELVASLYANASGPDVVQRSLLEQYLTADLIIETIGSVALRGGAVVSCMGLFFISRQLSLWVTRLVRRVWRGGSVALFHVPPGLIWVVSLSLLAVLLGQKADIGPLEIAAWNVLVVGVLLYLAQGVGIASWFFARRAVPRGMRLFISVFLVIMLFSPGINAVILGALALLGIAENWVPFRAPKIDGPSSTPGN